MKIAITFLCLVIASFIDPSTQNGYQIKLQDLPKEKVDLVVRYAHGMASKLETFKKCPESEKKARTKCFLEDLLSGLRYLAIDLECTVKDLLILINCPLDLIEKLLLNDLDDILDALNIEALLKSVLGMLEGVLAKLQILLKTEVLNLDKLLGSVFGVLSIVSGLHDTLGAVINGLTGTLLASVLGLVPAVLGLVGSILGGLG
ncbi:uncharacterized protein [Engystomops pustulosus]|uniref:uncharacterized protein n=1 Tax=Engystomops pustulosus TaxID=76066 RepID=UPI003AFA844B